MKTQGQTTEDNRDAGLLSNPLSFLHNGLFDWSYAGIWGRGIVGNDWSLRSANTTNSNLLYFHSTYLPPQDNSTRGYGFAVRSTAPPTLQTEKIVSLSALNSSFHV